MKSFVFGLVLSLANVNVSWAQDTWIHINGRSFHDSGHYRQWNAGLGIERKIDGDWTWAGGWYQNSIDRTSIYGSVKRMWRLNDAWQININMGSVTGYHGWPVAPVILPEACYGWVCGFFIPKLNHENTAAVAFYLRIPIK